MLTEVTQPISTRRVATDCEIRDFAARRQHRNTNRNLLRYRNKLHSTSVRTRASMVFPVPGTPLKRMPRGAPTPCSCASLEHARVTCGKRGGQDVGVMSRVGYTSASVLSGTGCAHSPCRVGRAYARGCPRAHTRTMLVQRSW